MTLNGTTEGVKARDLDRMLETLASRDRRVILYLLCRGEIEHETDVYGVCESGDRVHLFHNHLPVLADRGYIEWNREKGTITRGARFDEIDPILSILAKHTDEMSANSPDCEPLTPA